MISMQDATLRRAQDFARDRGWRCEPLRWEEIEVLVELAADNISTSLRDGYDEGYENGYADHAGEPLTLEYVQDWCADNGYTLVKAVAS